MTFMNASAEFSLRHALISVGNPHDQMTRCMEFVTIFSSASGRIFFRISLLIPNGIYSNKAQEYVENQALSGGVSTFLQSDLIL